MGEEILFKTTEDNFVPSCEQILQKRNEIIQNCKKGIYPNRCTDCPQLELKEWNEDQKITKLSIFHWLHCNCQCEYCFQAPYRKNFTDKIQKSQYYDAYPIIKNLYENNYLASSDEFMFEIGGGEVAILEEFPAIMDIMLKHNFYFCYIMSSGITYSPTIEKMLQHPKTRFSITISAGTKELFKKIKQRDKFEQVKDNIHKYIEKAVEKRHVIIRFIIDEGFNDTKKDIKDWLDTCENIGVKCVEICFDFCRGYENKKGQPYSTHLQELIDYYLEECKRRNSTKWNFDFLIDRNTQTIIERGHF